MTSSLPETTGAAQVEVEDRLGWQLVRLRTDRIVVELVPGLGGTITSVRRADGVELLWRSPWGLVHADARPRHPEAVMAAGCPGGWQTLVPGVTDTTALYGVDLSTECEARTCRFDWRQSGSSVIMTARLLRTPFEVTKIVSVRHATVTLGETVRNVGAEEQALTWASQLILGPPLVGEDTTVDVPAAVVHADPRVALDASYEDLLPWPRCYGPDGIVNLRRLPAAGQRQTRLGYLSDLAEARARVLNPASGVSVELEWDRSTWPHLWYSAETGARTGFPWFGSTDFLALSPSSSWPARPAADLRRISGTALLLGAGKARTSYLSLTVT